MARDAIAERDVRVRGVRLRVREAGAGDETIVWSHGLLWDGSMFEAQMRALGDRYRCLAFDHRGQGRSENPGDRAHDIETLYEDAVALIEQLGVAPCHFVGLSMGGFVGMRLAARRPDLVRSLVLMATTSEPEEPEKIARYRQLNLVARWFGVRWVASRVMPILYGRTFLEDPGRAEERAACRALHDRLPRTIHRAVRGVIERRGVTGELASITCPTLVLAGTQDMAIPASRSASLAAGIAGARLVEVDDAGHSMTVEAPEVVSDLVKSFLAEAGP